MKIKERKLIAVAGSAEDVGTSFVCGLLAAQYKTHCRGMNTPERGRISLTERRRGEESITLAELGKPYFYGALGFEKRFAIRGFVSYTQLLQNGSVQELNNTADGINWAVLSPQDAAPDTPELFRLIYNLPGDNVILDCSGLSDEVKLNVLAEADRAIVVIDPLPTRLLEAYSFLEDVRLRLPKAELLVNKMNKGVHKNELKRFLGGAGFSELPLYDQSGIYKAEYNCRLPAEFIDNIPLI